MDTLVKLATTDTEVERLLKGSVLLEAEQEAHKKTALKLDTCQKHLSKFLDEFEGNWDSDEQCDSPEIAQDYIDAAKDMAKHFGRVNNRVDAVQEWYDNYLPFGN